MVGLLPALALTLSCGGVEAMKLDFLRFPKRAANPVDTEHHLQKRAPTYITNFTLPDTNYTFIGCYSDTTANRVLTHDLTWSVPGGSANMTVMNCARAANVSGYEVFGIEYSQECWAGPRLAASSNLRSNSSCNMACKGNDTEWCGAGDFLSTYQLTSNITEIVYFTETTTQPAPTPVTPTTATTAATTTPTTTAPGVWHRLGCYGDLANGVRVFTNPVSGQVQGGQGAMTNEACQTTCQGLGYPFAGTEYHNECWCGYNFNGNNRIEKTADCNTPCTGNAQQMCGGPNRVTAWGFGDAKGPDPVPAEEPTTATTATTAATTATTPAATARMGWKYMGCFTDLTEGIRTFGQEVSGFVPGSNANMTNAGCQAACLQQGLKYCGTEWSQECFGSNTIAGANKLAAADTECNMDCKGKVGEKCGAGGRLSSWEYVVLADGDTTTAPVAPSTTTTAVVVTPVPTPPTTPKSHEWKSLGCYFDNKGGRAFTNVETENVPGGTRNLTNVGCTSTCERLGYKLAGTQYSGECWCSQEFHGENDAAPLADCDMPCNGNATEFCGAGYRMTTWELVEVADTTTAVTGTAVTTTTTDATSTTTETSTTEVVSSTTTSETETASTTTEEPTTTATTATATNTTLVDQPNLSTVTVSSTTTEESVTATVTDPATPTTIEASPTPTIALNDWNPIGCWYDQRGGRALSTDHTGQLPGGPANNTVQNCRDTCRKFNFAYSGTEYSQECWCGNSIRFQNVIAPLADCNMPCSGNQTESCGAGDRLTVWGFGTANGTEGSVGAPPTPTGPVLPAPTQPGNLPANWTYQGCYLDNVNGRILLTQLPDNDNLTYSNCINTCASRGFTVAGAQYASQCFCGQALYAGAALTAESECNMACSGNAFENCGAGNRMSVFSIGNVTAYQPPKPVASTGNWTYIGCWSDSLDKRALTWQVPPSQNNTAENCLLKCSEYGFETGGMQYGTECNCGDWKTVVASGATLRPETECAMMCPGNGTQICGDGNRNTMYNWTGTPLNEFNAPEGNEKGEYSMMIGGIVIPLIATLGINNKVMFLEKHGTGPPNSTGAYELDVSQVSNPDAAWRTLYGLKSDVFCAAGLTLPDKAGRQLNVGGWSAESLYGVRLYTPDGSEGVKGVNDWEENYAEVALQRGRWYPTAMTMANGSILIVGGEIGSNGPPEPTLEILPNPAGGRYLHMDWLLRTDPLNLYPFMYVLPGGGIFVAYYNEARILDPVTFETRTTLPNAPGSVIGGSGGRTYPLEGTAVMFPQYAPYTDPVTILMCGGAELYGKALDNCVSIQPEAANPTWTMERMPSPRVMTNMVALPDGKFLIMGGAKQGTAGFGLASDPNNDAVMYDPTKPLGSRMSVMGSTDIARLYHSETILLPDGSILVSGSDPQDNVHPQEYRMERFSPPYMLNGKAKPSFSLTGGREWGYGGSYGFSVTIPSGSAPRVALMGAVSATHGSSMGQRTYFPAISCGGNSCTVTAPPTANICTPGWYQMYVLDGDTPSYSQWVRIGGDPADLGSWPNTPSFKPPGSG